MQTEYKRLPDYLKRPIATVCNKENKKVKEILSKYNLNTVCDNARCPNKNECFSNLSATFLIMGKNCTRNCRFCSIQSSAPEPLDKDEPKNIAQAVSDLGLKYVVITSVTRDDIEDGGAKHFKDTVDAIREKNSNVKVEILTPDFLGKKSSLDTIIKAKPDVFNHNIETVQRLYKIARSKASYEKSIYILDYIKKAQIITKTGIMVGLGETFDEIVETISDIKKANVDILTVGQYIRPTKKHLAVEKYYTPLEFEKIESAARKIGIKEVISKPLARSSYLAQDAFEKITKMNGDGKIK